jgi:hypothetical protein
LAYNLNVLSFLKMFSRNKEDEIEYLKESLRNAKSELEREKLLNTAIKQKRVSLNAWIFVLSY